MSKNNEAADCLKKYDGHSFWIHIYIPSVQYGSWCNPISPIPASPAIYSLSHGHHLLLKPLKPVDQPAW